MKLGVIGGAGLLGSTAAFMTALKDIFEEIKLVDVNENAAKAMAMDMGQGILPFTATKIKAAGYEDLGDCEIILVAANKSSKQVTDRNERLKDNMRILEPISAELKKYCRQDPVYIFIANPVDVITYEAWKILGAAPEKVIGFDSNDSMRIKWAVGEVKGMDYRKIEGIVIGEHGAHQVRLIDEMTYDGEPIVLTGEEKAKVLELTGSWFTKYSALGVSRSTGWASGTNLAEMIEAIATESEKPYPASAIFTGQYGYSGLACGALCRLGLSGVKEILLPLNEEEKKAMDIAVASIKEMIATVE